MDTLEFREAILSKHCSALQNPIKKLRKTALENIRQELFKDSSDAEEEIIIRLFKTIQKDIIRCLRDDSEACREFAVNLLKDVIVKIPKDDAVLGYVFPAIRERLANVEIAEPSEEVRLLMIILLRSIVVKYGTSLSPYLNDYIEIFKKTIVDPYHLVKKESCECAADLSKAIPKHFHMQSESIIKPMVQAMVHQHFKIRVSVIKSLGDVICNGNNKSVNDVKTALAERLFDQNAIVRRTVAEVVGMWLLKLYDRYSYWHILVPLMLTSLSDEIKSQAEDAWKLWEAAGLQWISENENDIKDKLDFLPENNSLYPNGVKRPNIGCRELVQREMHKYIPAIGNELTDWKVDIRVKSAQLLCVTIQHAEQRITQSLSKILPPMYKAFCDEDPRVVENIIRSAELLGYFVPVEILCEQILPVIEDGANRGNLGILACVVKYSPKEENSKKIKDIVDVIDKDNICYSFKIKEQEQLLNLVSALLNNCERSATTNVTQPLFNILVCVVSVTEDDLLENKAKELLEKLQESNSDMNGEDDLAKFCTRCVLERIKPTVHQWTLHSPELRVFYFIMKELDHGIAANFDVILIMLKDAMDESMDPEVVLKVLWSIFDVVQNERLILILDDKDYFFISILTEILPKQLLWRAGRSSEALRTASTACLNQGLFNMSNMSSVKITDDIVNLFLPHLLSLAEDGVVKTRIYSLEALKTLIHCAKSVNTLSLCHVDTLIPVVMKRLDDVSNTVRLTSLKIIQTIYNNPTVVCGDHIIGSLQNTLLIHLDDPCEGIRDMVLDTLKYVGRSNPQSLLSKISIDSFRDKENCSKLVEYLKTEISSKKEE